jgi:hypothetical protein
MKSLEFWRCRFIGRFSAQSATIKGDIEVLNSLIRGGLDLAYATIDGTMACDGTNIQNRDGRALDMTGTAIEKDVTLRAMNNDRPRRNRPFKADGEVCLHGTIIGGSLSCSGAQLRGPTSGEDHWALFAEQLRVGSFVHMRRSGTGYRFVAKGGVNLLNADIGGEFSCANADASYEYAARDKNYRRHHQIALRLTGAKIGDDANLDHLNAFGAVVLDRCNFEGDLICQGASLTNDNLVGFGFSEPQACAFSLASASVSGRLTWQSVTSSGRLDLRHAKLGFLDDDIRSWFGAQYVLSGLEYTAFDGRGAEWSYEERLGWVAASANPAEGQPYDQVASVLRRMGRDSDAREIAIGKERIVRNADRSRSITTWSWARSKAWNGFLRHAIAYGYKPSLSLRWALVFIVVGTVVFYEADRQHVMVPTMGWARANQTVGASTASRVYVASGYPQFFAPVYAVDAFLPIVNLRQRDYWIPRPDGLIGWLSLSYLWLQTLAGWVLTSALVAALSGLVKKG